MVTDHSKEKKLVGFAAIVMANEKVETAAAQSRTNGDLDRFGRHAAMVSGAAKSSNCTFRQRSHFKKSPRCSTSRCQRSHRGIVAHLKNFRKKSRSAMNELEKLIASLAPSGPSRELDERIDKLLTSTVHRTSSLPWKWHGAWLATAASIGMVGFFIGRQSAAVASPSVTVASRPTVVPQQNVVGQKVSEVVVSPVLPSADARVMHIPLRHEPLASLFESFDASEGMLGNGPLKVVISNEP